MLTRNGRDNVSEKGEHRDMACPYFWPESPIDGAGIARAPLGGIYTGRCTAGATELNSDACNFGYASGRCSAFPAAAEGDAVRFSTLRDVHEDPLKITFIVEKQYSPVRHGIFHYSRQAGKFINAPDDPVLERQAFVFIARWVTA
jgi:hypothetical protein